MLNKIKMYYDTFGFEDTLKKIPRYVIYLIKTRYAKNGVYQISSKEKKNVILKNKRIFILAKKSYDDLAETSQLKKYIKVLNDNGYAIFYLYEEGKRLNKQLPLSYYKKNNKLNIKKLGINEKDIFIIEENTKEYQDILNKVIEKECNIIYFNPKKQVNKNTDSILNNIKDSEKCNDRFYDNISIIVLNYNNKKIIEKCIDSLIINNKRYKYEIIIIDNQSNDGSYEFIKQKYPKIKIFQNTKNGCSSGRNLGVKNSSKEYIVFLDSDQWVLNNYWLDNYLNIIEKNSKIGAVGWAAGWFDKKGYSHHTVDNFEYRYMPPMVLYRMDIGYLGTGGMIIKKSLFNDIKGFDVAYDPTCYEDTDLSLKIRNYGKEIVYCPYLGIQHLPHQTTKSGSESHEKMIKEKGEYFIHKWKSINPKLLKYRK